MRRDISKTSYKTIFLVYKEFSATLDVIYEKVSRSIFVDRYPTVDLSRFDLALSRD